MLHDFLTLNCEELIHRCREKVANRFQRPDASSVADNGAPVLLRQIADTLRREQLAPDREDVAPVPTLASNEIGRAATLHGADLLRLGYSIDQVVHDYGDVCQAVTELAVEQKVLISTDEFRTLNRCLDNAIADAVVSFGNTRQTLINVIRDRPQWVDLRRSATGRKAAGS